MSASLTNSLSYVAERSTRELDRVESVPTVSGNAISGVQFLKTASGSTVVAIHAARRGGPSSFFVMERYGPAFRILARGLLDNKTFKRGLWKAEKIDADGDDFDEVLFTGIKRNGRASHHRFVLYSPRERQTYVLEVQNSGRFGTPFKTVWSNNLLWPKSADYRRILRARANMAVSKFRAR